MTSVQEIARKIIEDDEYRDFLLNGVKQKWTPSHSYSYISIYNGRKDFDIVDPDRDQYIACFEGRRLKPSVKGCVVYNYKNQNEYYLKSPHYATMHHEDYKFYLDHLKEINDSGLSKYQCTYKEGRFVASKDSNSSFDIINPTFKTNIDNISLCAEKVINKSNQHTGNLKIALRFSKQDENSKDLSGTKLIEFDLGKNLKPSAAISDISESGKIQNDPDSGIYKVFFEVYELIVDGSWKLQSTKKIRDNFEWKSRKQFIAERLIEDQFYIENGTDDEISFYNENRESIEIIKSKILQKINEENTKKVNESAAEREQENSRQDAINNLKSLIDSLGNYIDSFDMALESGKLNDMDILRQLRTIDGTLSSIVDLKDNIEDKTKVLRNKQYISSIYERYKDSEKANKSACLRMETLISLFDEL